MKPYRAFISYSHRDAKFVHRIHTALENWRIDADLVGRQTQTGTIPKSLRPIFLDREDFAGGGALAAVTRKALDNSDFLIVCCSPAATQSKYVNDEIRLFKTMGKSSQIIPIIIDGDPNENCFPAALMQRFSPAGEMLSELEDPLAADAREAGDGRKRAIGKVVAGLLGVPFDEITKRAERAQQRRVRILMATAILMALLALAAVGFAWQSETRRITAERNYQAALSAADTLVADVADELVRIDGVQLSTTRRVIDRALSVLDKLSLAIPEAPELQTSKISALAAIADALKAKGDYKGAIEHYQQAEFLVLNQIEKNADLELNTRLIGMLQIRLGLVFATIHKNKEAIKYLEQGLTGLGTDNPKFSEMEVLQIETILAYITLCGLLQDTNRAADAIRYGEQGIRIAEKMDIAQSDNWRLRSLSLVLQFTQAEILVLEEDFTSALKLFNSLEQKLMLDIRERPTYGERRDLLLAVQIQQEKMYLKLDENDQAIAAAERQVNTINATVRMDADNIDSQILQTGNLTQEAESLAQQGDIAGAVAAFNQSIATLEKFYSSSPERQDIKTRLTYALALSAKTLIAHQLYKDASNSARRLLQLRELDLKKQPERIENITAAAAAADYLAIALESLGELEQALALRERHLALETKAALLGADNSIVLAYIYHDIGLLHWRLSNRERALGYYQQYVERLSIINAAQITREIEIDLGQGLLNLGELRAIQGDSKGALEAFQRCKTIREKLLESHTHRPQFLTDLAWAEARLAQYGDQSNARWLRVEALLTQADAMAPLGDFEEELLTVTRIALAGAQH